jgi:uncharacterized protein YlxP (DUF503 family)
MATVLALLHLELDVVQAQSLKDKRRAVKSFKTKIGNEFNVSVAEVDGLESHRRCVLAVAMVGNDHAYVEGALRKIVQLAQSHRDMVLTDEQTEWL